MGVVSSKEAVLAEQSARGIIDRVDVSKWAKEQAKDAFWQVAWVVCLKKDKYPAEQVKANSYITTGA